MSEETPKVAPCAWCRKPWVRRDSEWTCDTSECPGGYYTIPCPHNAAYLNDLIFAIRRRDFEAGAHFARERASGIAEPNWLNFDPNYISAFFSTSPAPGEDWVGKWIHAFDHYLAWGNK